MSIRIGRVVKGRVRIEQRPDHPRVYDADTGEDLTPGIRIEYQPRLTLAIPGQRIRFERFLREGPGRGRPILCGDRLLTEVWRAEVVA